MEQELLETIRQNAFQIRKSAIMAVVKKGEGHIGPALSCADIIATVYWGTKKEGDRFILSAGHKCLALYAALVHTGQADVQVLDTYNDLLSPLPGHPDMHKLAGVDFSTGSLGHGLGVACGFAMAAKRRKSGEKCYVLMGDGEQAEGTVWESAALAAHHKLDSIIAFVDCNHLQLSGKTEDVMDMRDLPEKYTAFGWHAVTVDGHDVQAIYQAICTAPYETGKPTVLICNTVKGKGLTFAENNFRYHHWNPDQAEKDAAVRILEETAEKEGWKV